MIEVTVKLPEERLAEFYAMYGNWLKASPDEKPGPDGRLVEWGKDDTREATFVWSNLHPRARSLFHVLLSASGPVAGSELAKALGPDAREDTVFGTFGPPAKLAKEVGRKHMIKSEHSEGATSYWLEPIARKLLEKIQTEVPHGKSAAGGNRS